MNRPQKRARSGKALPTHKSASGGTSQPRKKARGVGIKIEPGSGGSISASTRRNQPQSKEVLRDRFIALFQTAQHKSGISSTKLKEHFPNKTDFEQLALVINELLRESRLTMSKMGAELYYTLVSKDVAAKYHGLDVSERMVLQVIEKAGNMGIWTKEIRMQTNIQQQALNKIFKHLEQRQLIKPVKSVNAKAKKLYMLYNLVPSKELTGGVWYSGLEFDHEFISELRTFIMMCVRRLNNGNGITVADIKSKMIQAKVSRVELGVEDVTQIVQTLVYDYRLDANVQNDNGDTLYTMPRRVSTMCNFKWWEAVESDFHFRTIEFQDGVVLSPHEPHHHSF